MFTEETRDGHAAAESPNRRETARSRRMSRKFFGTLRRNQFRREQDLLRQLDITEVLPPTDVTDGDPVRNPEELKSMTTLSLNQKRRILNRMKEKFTNEGTSNIETLMRLRSGLDAKVRQARSQISGAIYTLGFWRGHLKVLQGHFGTDVTAYFVFLRWLFLANLFIGFIILLFLFMPQLVHRFYDARNPAPYYNNSFSAMDLLTGQGWFYNTEMYYGSYSNTSLLLINISSSLPDLPYDAPMAYLLTIGAYIGVFFVTMAFSTARSYRANYIESSSEFRFYYVAKVLIGWDCGILNGSTAKERKKSLLRELQEYVSSLITRNETKECSAVAETVARHLVAVVVQLGIIGGTGFLLYDLVTEKKIDQLAGDSYRRLTIGLLVTGFNGVLPFIFVLMSWLQRFEKEMYSILSTLVMTCMLYCSTLGSLMVALLKPHMVALLKPQVGETATSSTPCWETEVGSQLYQLAIMDFLFAIVVMVLVEGMHRLIWTFGSKWIGAPQFDIARNTQNLMYSQVLCWLGIYYCPMITVVTVIKLFILFYLKRYFIKVTCVPNTKHWKGAQMQTWFLIILFIFFIGSCGAFGVTLSLLTPSRDCGPFATKKFPVDLITDVNTTVVTVLISPGTMVIVIVALW